MDRRLTIRRLRREDGFGESGETGDLDAVAFVGAAFDDFSEEDDLVLPFAHGDVEVFERGERDG